MNMAPEAGINLMDLDRAGLEVQDTSTCLRSAMGKVRQHSVQFGFERIGVTGSGHHGEHECGAAHASPTQSMKWLPVHR